MWEVFTIGKKSSITLKKLDRTKDDALYLTQLYCLSGTQPFSYWATHFLCILRSGIALNELQLVLYVLQSIEETRRQNTN